MKQFQPLFLTVSLGFTDKDKALNLLRALEDESRVLVTIIKARISEHSAWLELEFGGENSRLIEVAALLQEAAGGMVLPSRSGTRVSGGFGGSRSG